MAQPADAGAGAKPKAQSKQARTKAKARSRPVVNDEARPQPTDAAPSSKRRPDAESPEPLAPGLYVVATPIGNLGDMSARARDVLARVDLVACEDTRVTGRLLAHFGIRARLAPYHDHNAAAARPRLVARLAAGARIALVADAGTPLISDPGYRLVAAAIAAGSAVYPVPGPSAPLAALVASGLPTDRFLVAGFLPAKAAARRRALREIAATPATLVLLESPRRLAASLEDMAAVLGPRPAAVARELTKRYEEVRRGPLDALARHYRESGAPRGEVVVVVGPPTADGASETDAEAVDAALTAAFAEGLSLREAASRVAAETGIARRAVYARALALRRAR